MRPRTCHEGFWERRTRGSERDERGRDHLASHTEVSELTGELVAGWSRLIAGDEVAGIVEPGDEPADGLGIRGDLVYDRRVGLGAEDPRRDRQFVDIETKESGLTGHTDHDGRLLPYGGSVRPHGRATHVICGSGRPFHTH